MVSELPETTYAVLGLVDKLPGSSGYELVAVADRSFAHFWPISQTLLYKELNRLAELGWVVASRVEQARSPTKSVYRSTPSGREALAGWLATTSQHTESFRSSFLLRFFLAHLMSARHLHALLGDYRCSLVERRDDLTAIVAGLEDLLPGWSHARSNEVVRHTGKRQQPPRGPQRGSWLRSEMYARKGRRTERGYGFGESRRVRGPSATRR